jgi:hypothetical protein
MKKQIILPLLIAITCCYGCEKTGRENIHPARPEPPSLRIRPPKPASQALVDSSGSLHNAVLETLYDNAGNYQGHEDFAHYLVTSANSNLASTHGFDPLPKALLESNEAEIVKLMSNNFYLLQKPQMDSIMNGTIDRLITSPFIDTDEKRLLNESRHIFDVDASMADHVVFDSIIARTNRLLTRYNAHSWPEGEGHAVGGFLNIARSSAQFWKSKNLALQASKLPKWIKAWGFPQFDAAGYIVGWGKAWLWDELETEKKRIGAGLSKGAEWSGIGGWFK